VKESREPFEMVLALGYFATSTTNGTLIWEESLRRKDRIMADAEALILKRLDDLSRVCP